ncbi:hypothetical protein [Mycobacterium intracellulare]|uniref:hypothetical protein n=1 Tax=Mycobacterium intracellulare TaxID=1767 RepID=UPI0019350760|nr:hypothetical protein [Mycobacterium intracellulare]BCP29570.1 hypothetical protein MINTM026_05400 [Mycobacterium intracellulare]
MINALRTLASAAFDALAEFTSPVADAIWDEARRRRPLAELTLLEEIADHAGTIRAQLEDIRNLIASAAPGAFASPADAAEGPAPTNGSLGAGHTNHAAVCVCGHARLMTGLHWEGCPAAGLTHQPQPAK